MRAKGFTLMEMATVLAIVSVVAAVLTPLAIGYVDQARQVAAAGDVKVIAAAIMMYQRDSGRFPIYGSAADVGTDTPSGDMLVGAGDPAALGVAWSSLTTTTDLVGQLNINLLGLATAAPLGTAAYRGPYIGSLDSDPWGNRYVLTAVNLKRTGMASGYWAFVISAGPDGAIDTSPTQLNSAVFATTGDDIVAIVR